jgi:hypothetical protein
MHKLACIERAGNGERFSLKEEQAVIVCICGLNPDPCVGCNCRSRMWNVLHNLGRTDGIWNVMCPAAGIMKPTDADWLGVRAGQILLGWGWSTRTYRWAMWQILLSVVLQDVMITVYGTLKNLGSSVDALRAEPPDMWVFQRSATWGTRRHLTSMKTKHRNRLNLESALMLTLTKIRPWIEALACQKQAQSSH